MSIVGPVEIETLGFVGPEGVAVEPSEGGSIRITRATTARSSGGIISSTVVFGVIVSKRDSAALLLSANKESPEKFVNFFVGDGVGVSNAFDSSASEEVEEGTSRLTGFRGDTTSTTDQHLNHVRITFQRLFLYYFRTFFLNLFCKLCLTVFVVAVNDCGRAKCSREKFLRWRGT